MAWKVINEARVVKCDETGRLGIQVGTEEVRVVSSSGTATEGVVLLPLNADGSTNKGTSGQFAVADGTGGIKWVDVENGNEEEY